MSVHLSPATEAALAEAAHERGTSSDALADELIRDALGHRSQRSKQPHAATMEEFLDGFIGVFDSRDDVPGGARMSEDPGGAFAEGMVRKRAQGHL